MDLSDLTWDLRRRAPAVSSSPDHDTLSSDPFRVGCVDWLKPGSFSSS